MIEDSAARGGLRLEKWMWLDCRTLEVGGRAVETIQYICLRQPSVITPLDTAVDEPEVAAPTSTTGVDGGIDGQAVARLVAAQSPVWRVSELEADLDLVTCPAGAVEYQPLRPVCADNVGAAWIQLCRQVIPGPHLGSDNEGTSPVVSTPEPDRADSEHPHRLHQWPGLGSM